MTALAPQCPSKNNTTLFYRFKPLRSNSGSPESLISYVRRLSEQHRLTPKRLLKILGDWTINGSNPENWIGNPDDLGQLHGYLGRARTLAEALEVATSVRHLKCHTFVPIANVIARNGVGGMSHYRKWCPLCLQEQSQQGLPLFTLLGWGPKAVTACSLHRVLLLDECSNCGKKQHHIPSSTDLSTCPYCQYDLLKYKRPTELGQSDSRVWIARQIEDLLSDHDYGFAIYETNLIGIFLDRIARTQNIPIMDIGESTGLAGCTVHEWWQGRNRPSLEYLLWILYSTKIPIRLLLDDPVSAANQACIFGIRRAPDWLTRKRRTTKRKWNHSEVRKRAKEIISKAPRKSVVRKISEELGIPEGTIRYICSDLLFPKRRPKLEIKHKT